MPELRRDPVVGRWVIIATDRGRRPSDFGAVEEKKRGGFCPFCPGNEGETPPEITAIRSDGTPPNTPGWSVRVVPNKYPVLQIEGDLDKRGIGLYDRMNGVGAHEVIIETPDHRLDLVDLPVEQISSVIRVIRERINDLKRDTRFRNILIFKNHGQAAGASLEHTHCQLIATPTVPKRVQEELDGSRRYFDYKERCIYCDIIRQEMNDGERVVNRNDRFVSLEAYASRFPFETWIIPLRHQFQLGRIDDDTVPSLAEIIKDTLTRIKRSLNSPPYNLIIHSSPLEDGDYPYFHWHIEIMPKLTKVAGFEWGSGFYINPTPPEEAARYMRDLDIKS
jgi:UDPglucose--hexose-1-phosphate uridylyltransferase